VLGSRVLRAIATDKRIRERRTGSVASTRRRARCAATRWPRCTS